MGSGFAYESACSVAGLEPADDGYGVLFVLIDGQRFTVTTSDVAYRRLLVAVPPELRVDIS